MTESGAPEGGTGYRLAPLDGLRAVAVTMVGLSHLLGRGASWVQGGWVGVTIFFVLSGFLITTILVDEERARATISLRRFYLRRALRLGPALFTMLVVWSAVMLVAHREPWFSDIPAGFGPAPTVAQNLRSAGLVLAYVWNWFLAFHGIQRSGLSQLWSLSVEEQFYLCWPLLLLSLLRWKARTRRAVVLALCGGSAVLPLFLWRGGSGAPLIYFGTATEALCLLSGAFCAFALASPRGAARPSVELGRATTLGAAAALLLIFLRVGYPTPSSYFLALPSASVAAAIVVAGVVVHPGSFLGTVLSRRVVVWLGRRSYAVYMWSFLWTTWLGELPLLARVPAVIAATLLTAELSWRLVEAPALRVARRFGHGRSVPLVAGKQPEPA